MRPDPLTRWRTARDFLTTTSLARSVAGLLTLAIVLMLLVNLATFVMIQRTEAANNAAERAHDIQTLAREVRTLAIDAETGQRGFLLTGRPEYLEPHDRAVADLPVRLRELTELTQGDSELAPRARQIRSLAEQRVVVIDRAIELARMGRGAEAIAIVRTGQGKTFMDAIRTEIASVDALLTDRIDRYARESRRNGTSTVITNGVGGALILVLAAIGGWLVRRYITDMQRAREEMDRLNVGLEDTVRVRTAALSRANEEVQRFAYIVSHDLRAPLVNVMGYTSELERAGEVVDKAIADAEKVREVNPEVIEAVREDIPEAIGFIRASTEKMDRLINAILKLSRDGRRNLAGETLDMTALVEAIARSVHHQTDTLGAKIVVNPLPTAESDRLAIEQVFGNLIDNAVKYLNPARPGVIEVSGEVGPDGSRIYRVADNGRGITDRDHERIFELFRRSGRQDTKGEGLGLAFVRNSVRRLGGDITVKSTLGEGSTFVVTLPTRLTVTDVGDSL